MTEIKVQQEEMGKRDYVVEFVPQELRKEEKRQAFLGLPFGVAGALFMVFFVRSSLIERDGAIFLGLGIAMALCSVAPLLIMRQSQRMEERLYQEGRRYQGTVIGWEYRQKSGTYPVYEFYTEKGWHKICATVGGSTPKWKRAAFAESHQEVWYMPELAGRIGILKEEERKQRRVSRKCQVVLFFILEIFFLLVGGYQWLTAYRDEGADLLIDFPAKYEESSFTEEEIESDTVDWIDACYAIYSRANGKNLKSIGGYYDWEAGQVDRIKKALEDGWGITDRKSTIRAVRKLLVNGGHRAKYQNYVRNMEKDGWLDLKWEAFEKVLEDTADKEFGPNAPHKGKEEKYRAAFSAYQRCGENGIDAWDYCRTLQILGDAYRCGYINLEECLNQSLAIAAHLQEEYGSWDEMCRSYLYGYWFWSNSESDYKIRAYYYQRLLDESECPYDLDYDTELISSW